MGLSHLAPPTPECQTPRERGLSLSLGLTGASLYMMFHGGVGAGGAAGEHDESGEDITIKIFF